MLFNSCVIPCLLDTLGAILLRFQNCAQGCMVEGHLKVT